MIQIDVLLTLYELIEFCLLVIYNKPGVVQNIYCWSQVFIKKVAFLSLNIIFVSINSEDPDEMPYDAPYIWVFTVCQITHLEANGIHRVK